MTPGGVKENLKPCVYKLWEHLMSATAYFCRNLPGELRWLARLNGRAVEPKGNQVLRGRISRQSRPETG